MDLTTVTLIAFVALVLVVAGILLIIRDLGRARGGSSAEADKKGAEVLPQVSLERETGGAGSLGRMDRSFGRLMIDSGLPMNAEAAFLLMVLVGVSAGAAVFLMYDQPIIALAVTPAAMLLPLGYFMYARARRLRQMYEQLPAALETMSRAVRAGESVEDALRVSGDVSEEPISTELRRCAGHLDMGLSMAATMRSLTSRIRIEELKILSSALVVQRSSGGNLSTTLDRVIALIRDRQNYHRQFRAGTAGARLAALLVMLALPAYLAFMVFYGAEYGGAFLKEPMGWGLLAAGVSLLLVGMLWIFSMLKIDY